MRDSLDVPGTAPEPPGLYATLATRARRMSDGALAACAGGGVLAATAVIIIRPGWWVIAMPLVALGAFGTWGIADREASGGDAVRRAPTLRAVRWIAVGVGTVAALIPVFALLGVLLGTLMS